MCDALLDLLPDRVDWVIEYCGGVGGFSILVRELLDPDYHIICDLDTLCCHHLLRAFPLAIVARGDYNIMAGALEPMIGGVGLSVADFNTFTIGRLHKEPVLQRVVARMQIAGNYAIITDSAKSYLHLNADSYSELMGVTITDFESYCQAMDGYMATYGKMVVAVAHHFRAAYILIADRVDGNVIQYIPAGDDARDWFKEIL